MSQSFFQKLVIVLAAALATVCYSWAGDLPADKYKELSSDREILVPMRDGVHLSTTVVRPTGAAGKLPTVLVRSPYDDTSKMFGTWLWLDFYVKQGYAVVLQDERGRGFSEGNYQNVLQNAREDGYDTIDWIVKQSWSNGKVGTTGCSTSGGVQWPLAAANHPGHAAMIPGAAYWAVGEVPGNETRGVFYRGGVPLSAFLAWWYSYAARSERLLLPPNSTQDQRIRLRNSYSVQMLQAKDFFGSNDDPNHPGVMDPSKFMQLPSKDMVRQYGGALTPFDNYITWTPGDKRWDEAEEIRTGAKPRVPALHIITWHDPAVTEATRLFKYLQDFGTPNQYLIVGPGPHCSFTEEEQLSNLKFGDLEVGDARYGGDDHGYQKLFLNWFDYWLKGEENHVTNMPKVQLYVMGKGWISGDQWPLKEVRFTKYYLTGDSASLQRETGVLTMNLPNRNQQDSYVYDPSTPTPSPQKGGVGVVSSTAALDQRPVEARKDVLVYSTPSLEKPLTIAGPIDVVLYVSSSAKDTDFIVKLVDVYPDGKAIELNDDAFRVRYREGFDRKVLMQPGGVYKIGLSNMVAAIRFQKGHRIRLDISSSSFPEYERNLNTGGNNYDETAWVVAENSIHHGPQYPSHVVLPVLPD